MNCLRIRHDYGANEYLFGSVDGGWSRKDYIMIRGHRLREVGSHRPVLPRIAVFDRVESVHVRHAPDLLRDLCPERREI